MEKKESLPPRFSAAGIWARAMKFFRLVGRAAQEFMADNAMKLSASLSYYTLFSLAPMLLIVIAVSGSLLGKDAVEGYLYAQFEGLIGAVGAVQLQEMIRNVHISGDTPWVTAIGVITMFLGATGVFVEIQDSINTIWSIKVKPKRGWLQFIRNRFLSFSIIVGIGFMLLVSLALSALMSMVFDKLQTLFGDGVWAPFIVTNVISGGVVFLLFVLVFKVLPDAKLTFRDVMVGALFTTILFLLGKYLINLYLSRSATVTAYGAAGAIVLIILWVYYSAAILFFGAEFTKVYANEYGNKIQPDDYAVFIEQKEVQAAQPVLKTSPTS